MNIDIDDDCIIKPKRRHKINPKLAHKFISENVLKLSKNGIHRCYYHYLVPGFNMSLQDIEPDNLAITPNRQLAFPICLYVSSNIGDKMDLCYRRVSIFHGFAYKIRYNASIFEKYLEKKNYRKATKSGIYPTAIVRGINLINAYPYPYFSGEYDWYFTGGNLACMENFLLTVRGKNMNTLNISTVKLKGLKSIADIDCDDPKKKGPTSEILEIQASNSLKNRFVVRFEKNLAKYFYDGCEIVHQFNIYKPNIPFITFSEDPLDENFFITGDLNRQIHLWDINNSTKIPCCTLLSQKEETLDRSDNWNCIRYLEKSSFVYADFEKFALIDKRTEAFVDEINFSVFKEEIGICEKISSLLVSNKYSNVIYIGTTHKLYAVDVRYIKKKSQNFMLLKWVHQMKYPPLMLKSYSYDDSELLAASSPLNGEIRLFEIKKNLNENSKKIYTSPFLPVVPPDFNSSFYFAKLQGECLNPLVDFESRIKKCTTGIDFLEKNNKLRLLIANSVGDVFSSKIINGEFESKQYHTAVIKDYYHAVEDIARQTPKELYVTDLKDLTKMCKILRSTQLYTGGDSNLCENNDSNKYQNKNNNNIDYLIEEFPMKKRKLSKWEKTPAQYAECKDVLAPTLLDVWDFDIDKTGFAVTKTQETKERSQKRVEAWIEDIQKNYYEKNKFIGDPLENEYNIIDDSEHYQADTCLNENENNIIDDSEHYQANTCLNENENNIDDSENYQVNTSLIENENIIGGSKKCQTKRLIEKQHENQIDERTYNDNLDNIQNNSHFGCDSNNIPNLLDDTLPKQIDKSKKNNVNKIKKKQYVKGF